MIEIALYQPDIAPNVGTIARTCACFGLSLTVIEPAGFTWNDSKLLRAGMDYLDVAAIRRAASWNEFQRDTAQRRLVLLTTKSSVSYLDFEFERGDILVLGSESRGVPDTVHHDINHRVTIPLQKQTRSLNVAIACAIGVAEALRQLRS